jgi:hypothetical protein
MRNYQTKPIYIFGGFGLLSVALGAVLSAYVLYEKFVLKVWVHRNPLFQIAIMFSLMGVQFLVLGLIAEIMVRTYFEAQDKTAYLIAETAGFDDGESTQAQTG